MAKFWLCAAVGFYLLPLCLAQIGLNISCRYAGVFHVEKNRRYSLTREDAVELCKALNSTIPTLEQMQKAFALGFETCRYGYIEDKVVVPRHTPYHLCAANNTGIYILASNISDRYDTYCFNSSETREKVCDPVIKLYSVLPNNNNTIEIFNADGSHYIEGEKYTDRPPVTEDETSAGSGSANDRGTTEPNFIRHGVSQYPHPADSSTIPYLIGRDDEVSDNYEEGNSEDQHPKSTTVGVSNNGKHHDNATQGQQVPEDFPLWWSSKEHEERHKTTSRKDESTEENDDDGGGDDGDDDNEEGSGQINRETVLEWNNSGDQEPPPSNTTVVLSKDIKNEDSAHDSFLHGVHSEKDSEVRYSTNGTKEDVPPGIGPLSDDEHYPTTTAASSSDDFFNQENQNQHPQDGGHSGLETGDTVPTATTTSDTLPTGLVPSSEKESMLGKGDFHHTVTFSNESVGHAEAEEEPLSVAGKPGRRSQGGSTTNRTITDVVNILTSPNERDRENELSQTADERSNDGMKHEESTQDPVSYGTHLEWDSEEIHLSNTSSKEVAPGIVPPVENEHKNESFYTVVVATDETNNEDSTNNTLIHGVHSVGSHEDRHSSNTSRDGIRPGIASTSESKDDKYLEISHTVVPSSSTHYEDSSHDTVLHREHSEWDSEEKYLTNTSGEYLLPGIIHPTESDHEKESSHTVQSSSNDAKHEDAMRDPMLHQEQGREDNYHTNNTEDDIFLENIPPTGYSSDEKIFHTVIVHNDPEDSTQEPLPPTHQPGWDPEEKYPTNTSRDDVLVEVDTDSKNEHDLSFTDVVFHGTKEDSTLEPVSQWGSEDQYTTQSPADVLVPGIVPRRGINQKNKTDHTVGVSSDGAKGEESTQHPPMHGLHPGGSNNGEVNNTEDYRVPGVFSEVGSDSDRRSSTSTASINPEEREGGVSHTGKNVTPLPGEFPKSQPRKAHIPDWLIVVASLLALALILGVCIAVNSRRRCGQKKKLVINNGKGGIDEKNVGGLNGEASKSQEMVHLVHKEKPEDQTGSHDEFLAIDETQNQQDVALKSGI
ncbi:CD44 antigen isoform X3 [Pogona vitticeps]